jgi:type III secretion protein J
MLRRLMVLVHACRRLGGQRLGRGRWLPLLFACLTTLSACSSDVNILTVTSESDANEVMSSLLNNGITPSRSTTKTGIVIAVPSSDMANALEVLRQAGLPRERFEGLGKTFQKEGMISSPVEERALYVHALSQELANTLSKIDGVVVARVHLVLPEPAGVDRVATPAKAGVFIKYHADQPLDAVLPQLRTMITHAIPGLTADNVSVALVPATTGKEPVKPTPGKDILGVTVAPESVAKMEFIIGGLLLAALVSIGAGGLFWWRHGRGGTEARRDRNSGKGKDGEAGKTATPASGNQDRGASRV